MLSRSERLFIAFALVVMSPMLVMLAALTAALAHDDGQWDNADPVVVEWYQHLMQPDHPESSCCGEADAYWCDEIHVKAVSDTDRRVTALRTFCTITDDRPDEPRHRPHIDVGTEIEIPDFKLKWDRGNPTGHSIVFLSYSHHVFCFVQGGGA